MNTNWIYLPVQYLKNSFKKIDDRTIEFKIKNMEGSARVNISPPSTWMVTTSLLEAL